MPPSQATVAAVAYDTTDSSPTPPSGAADPDIVSMLRSVDAARIGADVKKLAGFGTRHSLSDTKSETRGIGAAARWLKSRFDEVAARSGGRLEVRLADFTAPQSERVPKPWPMQNVVAVLRGNVENRVVVVSGHYDSRATDIMNATGEAPGANDDASGVAVVLEACRALSSHRFEASVVFAAVSGEEQGLLGSRALLDELKREGKSVDAMLTNDIVGASVGLDGRSDKKRVRVFSAGLPAETALRDKYLVVGGEADGPGRQLARAIDEATNTYVSDFDALLVLRFDRYLRGGDHKPFHEAGFPAARLTEVEENFTRQHQDVRPGYGDLAEHVDPSYVANVARVNIATLASLARAPSAPKNVKLDVRGLDEDTTLLFVPDPNTEIGYEVLARPSNSSGWTERFAVDRSGKARITLSKDHYVFALRAVGPRGHRSLAVFPLPLMANDPWPPPGK